MNNKRKKKKCQSHKHSVEEEKQDSWNRTPLAKNSDRQQTNQPTLYCLGVISRCKTTKEKQKSSGKWGKDVVGNGP
jgi:hypothetical protein